MKFLILFFTLINLSYAKELAWNCGTLELKWTEIPGEPGVMFKVDGCWQTETFYLISADCKKDASSCLAKGKGKEIAHPGGRLGSPEFIQCYRLGGKPRFLEVKAQDKWEKTVSCFFGSQNSFMDYDSIKKTQKVKN